jgi:hypothetical protein
MNGDPYPRILLVFNFMTNNNTIETGFSVPNHSNEPQANVEVKNDRWILILDNLDDERLLHEPLRFNVQDRGLRQGFLAFLPHSHHGTIILTTSNKKVKVFLQLSGMFWQTNTQLFLHAHPTRAGYNPVFQSLLTKGFMPSGNILLVAIIGDEACRVELPGEKRPKQSYRVTRMFPDVQISDPEETSEHYPGYLQSRALTSRATLSARKLLS